MGFNDKKEVTDTRPPGVSTAPGESVADSINAEQVERGETQGPTKEGVKVAREHSVELDRDAVEILDPSEVDREPQQVEPEQVVFVPHKDFAARVNTEEFYFTKDVPARISRDLANILLEDRDRGYLKD